jgi:hypothetical protein
MLKCAIQDFDVIANDTDPENNLPLSLVDVTSLQIAVSRLDNRKVQFESGSSTGVKTATYTVSDSLGNTSTGTVTVTVSGGACTN